MANRSKQKGYRGEREVMDMLQVIVNEEYGAVGLAPPELTRSPAGRDIRGLPFVAIEVKYREQVCLNPWWGQTKRNALAGQEPVLIWRSNYEPWRVRMFGYLRFAEAGSNGVLGAPVSPPRHVRSVVDISCDAFLVWFRHRLKSTLSSLP